jgi:hypothetical protein
MDQSIQFPIEKTYNDLIIRLFFVFIILSFLTLLGVIIFFDIALLNVITVYAIAVVVFVIVIITIEVEMHRHLEIRYARSKEINRTGSSPGKLQRKNSLTHSLICPFCDQFMEIKNANDREYRSFSNIHKNCIHYRDIVRFKDGFLYGKFVIQKENES